MSEVNQAVWTEITGYVRAHHAGLTRGWFSQLQPGDLNRGSLRIIAANAAQLTYLNRHCVQPFVEAAQSVTGRLVGIEFETLDGIRNASVLDSSDLPPLFERETQTLRLNADYTFENFVVGQSNRLAHASCWAVGESPGSAYNPLFIHGSVGLGKTHLLQAVCHRILDAAPATRILYLTCETFVNHFVEAVGKASLDNFRYRYRHVDVLIVDDIQFLAGKDSTQEEFFHTFNTLYQLDKQIILSADCSPSEIPSLEERLISRFNWGLVARIDAPCLETRMAIIQRKATLRRMEVPNDVVAFIASRVHSNIRELEGALNRIQGLAAAEGRPIDLPLARQALGDGEDVLPRQISIQEIMNLVMQQFNVKLSDLQGRRRSRSIVLPRQVCMYLARSHTDHSLNEIGGFFGGRDHTTVLHANRLVAARCERDMAFRLRIEAIEAALAQGGRNGASTTPRD